MVLVSIQTLTKMSTRIFLEIKGSRLARKADNLIAIREPIVKKM
jgi:hypothetical protein